MPHTATARQLAILAFVRECIEAWGYAPSQREIANHLGISPQGVRGHLVAMQKKGLLRFTEATARSLVVED